MSQGSTPADDSQLAQELSELWRNGSAITLREFLAQHPALTAGQLAFIYGVDQRQRWKSGDHVLVEEYFQEAPSVRANRSAALDLIYNEIHLREENGETISDDEFLRRFPELASELKIQLEIHRLIDECTPGMSATTSVATIAGSPSEIVPAPGANSKNKSDILPVLPGYRLIKVLGHGGMGIVYLAWHEKLKRHVAVKVIKASVLSDPAARQRFEAEGRAIARLNQPNIVQIYEVGENAEQMFLSIEYCAGGSLAKHLQGTPLPVKQAVEICRTISLAIHHAHERGIIHRDLKPANVVLYLPNEQELDDSEQVLREAIPKVSDFGLARTADEAGHTRAEGVLGTPSYMSPEQARNPVDVTRQSDIYSLGAILYELLTGRPPFKATSMIETVQQVLGDDPVAPKQLVRSLPKDLDTICLKALHKEPSRRYETALDLANDLTRFMAGQPVLARPVSNAERCYRWSKRNPGWSTALVSLVMLIAIAGMLTWRNIAQAQQNIADLLAQQKLLQEEQQRTVEEKERTAQALASANQSLYFTNIAQVANSWAALNIQSMKDLLEKCPVELRNWEWKYLHALSLRRDQYWQKEAAPISSMAFEPQKQWVASANLDGELSIYEYATQKRIYQRQLDKSLQRVKMSFLNDGQHLLFGEIQESTSEQQPTREQFSIVSSTDAAAQPFTWKPTLAYRMADLVVCAKTKQLAVLLLPSSALTDRGIIKIFDTSQLPPKEVAEFDAPGGDCRILALAPDGRLMAVAGGSHLIYLMDTKTQQVVDTIEAVPERPARLRDSISVVTFFGKTQELVEWGLNSITFSDDGKQLAAGLHNGQLRVWNVENKKLTCVVKPEDEYLLNIRFSPDNKRLAVNSVPGVIHIIDLPDGQNITAHQGHTSRGTGLCFDQKQNLLSSSRDGTIRRWPATDRADCFTLKDHTRSVLTAGFQSDSQVLATADGNLFFGALPSTVRFWKMSDLSCSRVLQLPCASGAIKFDPGNQRVAIGGGDRKIRIYDMQSDQPQILQGHRSEITAMAWHPDKDELASAEGSLINWQRPGNAILWDTQALTQRLVLSGHTAALSSVLYSPDGNLIATASADKTVRIWKRETGESVGVLADATEPILSLAIDPQGKWIAGGTGDVINPIRYKPGEIYVWSFPTGKLLHVMRGHTQLVHGLSVSADGQRLVSCARNDKVRIWDPSTGTELLNLTPSDYACGVYFSPDGQHLAVPNWSGKIDLFSGTSATRPAEVGSK